MSPLISCKEVIVEKDAIPLPITKKREDHQKKIHIKSFVPKYYSITLNLPSQYKEPEYLHFDSGKADTIMERDFILKDSIQMMTFSSISVVDQKYVTDYCTFLIEKEDSLVNLYFDYDLDNLKTEPKKVYRLNKLNKSYLELKDELRLPKNNISEAFMDRIDSTFRYFQKNFQKGTLEYQINNINYHDLIEFVDPGSVEVENYMMNLNQGLINSHVQTSSLRFNFIKNRIDRLNFDTITDQTNNEIYLNELAIGIYKYASFEDHKGDANLSAAIKWLKKTKFYEADSLFLKSKIEPLNNQTFKTNLLQLSLLSNDLNTVNFESIFNNYPSEFYLIDFWATWCLPCIAGMKEMQKMDFPKNLKVIQLSVDDLKDKNKWVEMSKSLNQSFAHYLNPESSENQKFLEMIELQSVPRYLLIDSKGNLIDQAFYHPQEPQFLSKLKDVKNHKYW